MGLGKSLTVLSAIASSLNEAAEFASTWTKDLTGAIDAQVPSRATLIMVPSSSKYGPIRGLCNRLRDANQYEVLVDNWIDEIRA